MTITFDYFQQGQDDARAYHNSPVYSGLNPLAPAEEAMRLFWPPTEEAMVMFSSPLPKSRQKWLAGFRQERLTILAENIIACRTCGQPLPTKEKTDEER